MDTTYHSNIPIETLSLLDCDVRNFDFNHPIQFELIRLIQEAGGLKKPEEKNRHYKDHPKGFYVYAKFKSDNVNIKFTKMDRLIFTNLDRII